MLKLSTIMLGSAQPKALAEFYQNVFGTPAQFEEEGWSGWQVGGMYFMVGAHSEVLGNAKEPQRVIFNFETTEVKEEFARIKRFGGKVIKEPYELQGGWIATLADPDGNYFQVTSPWDM